MPQHVLFERDLTLATSWAEWKDGFERETDANALLGRLHGGFGLYLADLPNKQRVEIEAERACLYLDLADGYRKTWHRDAKEWAEYHRGGWSLPSIREEIARQAMQLLARHFFKMTERVDARCWPNDVLLQPKLFQKLLWFFRSSSPTSSGVRSDGTCDILNLDDHYGLKEREEILRTFAKQFCRLIWGGYLGKLGLEPRAISDATMMIEQARPRVLQLMIFLNDLDFLLESGIYSRVDPVSLSELTRLALQKPYPCHSQVYRSLDEALMGDTFAPRVLLVLQQKLAIGARQTK